MYTFSAVFVKDVFIEKVEKRNKYRVNIYSIKCKMK